MIRSFLVGVTVAFLPTAALGQATPDSKYVKKGSRSETILATLKATGFPTLEGPWYHIGPFDNDDNVGFDTKFGPELEKQIDLKKQHPGKGGKVIGWEPSKNLRLGSVVNLKTIRGLEDFTCVYLYHEITVDDVVLMPLSLGSDDGLKVWLNGKELLAENVERGAGPDQNRVELKLAPGKNHLLLKVTNVRGEFAVYVQPEFPKAMPVAIKKRLERDYPLSNQTPGASASVVAESKHYRISTIPLPSDCVLEVGGLGFRADGGLLACTRRGEVWLFRNPLAEDPADVKASLFATGLHEALGLNVESDNTVYVVQRPELTKLTDRDGDGVADEYETVCDKWGVSGDYHEFAFGLPRDKDGNFYITLNVGFGGGDQAKGTWRGWCVKVSPKGNMEPFALGLRSPNGITMSPEGELFYSDNQGEWVATNKLHHIRKGDFFGHPAGLRFIEESPFKGKWATRRELVSGMLYDGQQGTNKVTGMPKLNPPAIWFPYGRMGQSASEPCFDTTGGKFGPFEGQCFVGDQTKSSIQRVALEKVKGVYQGACFPFRSGFQCGINRLAFAKDGSVFAGQTNRGWGSVGGKPYGLQRLVYTGELPFEIHTMRITPEGFDLTFTKPIDPKAAEKLEGYSTASFTYNYFSNYGSPEVDRKNEKVTGVKVSSDSKKVSLKVNGIRRGRVYELRPEGIRSTQGESLLHPEAYYTVNELP